MTTHNKKASHQHHAVETSRDAVSNSATPARENHGVAAVAAPTSNLNIQTVLIFALVIAAFFGAYRFARATGSSGVAASAGIGSSATQVAGGTSGLAGAGGAATGGGGGCCGGGGAAPQVTGTAKLEGGVQKIAVDASRGYNPNTIQLKAGIPTEITFSQSGGCTAIVQSQELGFQEDLSSGPKTVKLGALKPGTYGFACGMNMVRGTIVVQ